ncbi:MAG: sigma-54-dependent Fis family transcriptional regulator [Deltaproteobacteria bacterium]|nr:sigma-54-dependent Fis family transcriptional regulator [Deltaproteobacteria bacterium]
MSLPVASPATKPARPLSMRNVIGDSTLMLQLFGMIDRVGRCHSTVLITGESGTGKELVARAVHDNSPRSAGPFVVVNCGAIPEALLESELFGHARGAFTGAHQTRQGRVAAAKGGTLFLDEIGELPLALQVKLLRLLQQHEYSPVGDTRTMAADVRIVAATNKDLESEVAAGMFREDLYYRLNVIHLRVPSLRNRTDDIPALVDHFLVQACKRVGRSALRVSRAAMELLASWSWPGNVRELENTIERSAILCQGETIEPGDLPSRIRGLSAEQRFGTKLPDAGLDLRAAVESFENELIRQALDRTSWNKNRAARLLGLNRTTLVEMLKRKRLSTRAA